MNLVLQKSPFSNLGHVGFLESDLGFLKSDLGSVELAESNLGCADLIKSEMHWKRGITNLCRQ